MIQSISKYEKKIESLVENYKKKGFDVEVEPSIRSLEDLPFDLVQYNYIPDLIATRNNEGAIVEIRSKHKRQQENKYISVSKLQKIAEIIGQYENWHFLIATIEDSGTENELEQEFPQSPTSLPSWKILLEQQSKVLSLIETCNLEPALLYQVSIFEASLRKRAFFLSLTDQDLSGTSLLNNLYSLGEISVIQIDICQKYLKLRNQIAYGFLQVIDPLELAEFYELVQILLQDWSIEESESISKSITQPFSTTHLDEIAGCLQYTKKPKSLEEIETAVAQGITEEWHDHS